MFHKIKNVNALPDFKLSVQFAEGVTKIYDVSKLFDKYSFFKHLQDNPELFSAVTVDLGGYGVIWNNDIDIFCDELFANGELVKA